MMGGLMGGYPLGHFIDIPGTLNQKPLTYQPRPEYDHIMDDNTNKCAECSSDGTPDALADVTHCENCGLPIEGRRSLWT